MAVEQVSVSRKAKRRGGIRIAAQYLREARAENPNATPEELREVVAKQLEEDFGADEDGVDDWVPLLLQLVELILRYWLKK